MGCIFLLSFGKNDLCVDSCHCERQRGNPFLLGYYGLLRRFAPRNDINTMIQKNKKRLRIFCGDGIINAYHTKFNILLDIQEEAFLFR